MNLTPEQLASARAEEAKIASRHAVMNQDASKTAANLRKNGKLYEQKSLEVKAKTNGRKNTVRIFRQCPEGVEPEKYTLNQIDKITYMDVQYFRNNKSGLCSNVLKIRWSTHKDAAKAKSPRYQTETYYNLYLGYDIARRTKPYGKDDSKIIAQTCKAMNEYVDVAESHPMQEIMYGYSTVQCEKRGTKNFLNFNVTVVPSQIDGKNKTILYFNSDGVTHEVLLHDVSKRRNKNGTERDARASKMIGYLPTVSESKANAMLKALIQKAAAKKAPQGAFSSRDITLEQTYRVEATARALHPCIYL